MNNNAKENLNNNNYNNFNNFEEKKYSEIINNIFLENDAILNTESVGKSVDSEERNKLITPKFSPLSFKNNLKMFEFGDGNNQNTDEKGNKRNVLLLLLKSW